MKRRAISRFFKIVLNSLTNSSLSSLNPSKHEIIPKCNFEYENSEVQLMLVAKERLKRHIPVLLALLCLTTGDYLALIRHIRLFL